MIVIAVAVLVVVLAAAATLWATGLESTANQGKTEVEAGVARLASMDATGAASQFDAAKRSFSSAQGMLGPDWLGAAMDAVPLVGRQYAGARTLLEIGQAGSTAGAEVAAALQQAPAGSAETHPRERTRLPSRDQDPAHRRRILRASRSDRRAPRPWTRAVSCRRWPGGSSPSRPSSRTPGRCWIGPARCLPLEKYLLYVHAPHPGRLPGRRGAETHGRVHRQLRHRRGGSDRCETRGVPGRLRAARPARSRRAASRRGLHEQLPLPGRELVDRLPDERSLHARASGKDSGQPPVDGIVAIDTVAMKYLLEALGPVRVPSYSETFTADNLLPRLLYYTQVTAQGRKDRKGVLVALATEVEQRMLRASRERARLGGIGAREGSRRQARADLLHGPRRAGGGRRPWGGRGGSLRRPARRISSSSPTR